jgi:hypothetical protein
MVRAVIGAMGDIDAHMLPDAKGFVALTRRLVGDTAEQRATMRGRSWPPGPSASREFGEALDAAATDACVVMDGPGDSVDSLAETLPGLVRVDAL